MSSPDTIADYNLAPSRFKNINRTTQAHSANTRIMLQAEFCSPVKAETGAKTRTRPESILRVRPHTEGSETQPFSKAVYKAET